MEFELPESNIYDDDTGASDAALVVRAFRQRGYAVDRMGQFFRVSRGDHLCFVHWSDTSYCSSIASRIWKSKSLTRRILGEAGISMPRGKAFPASAMERGQRFAEGLSGIVVKPADGKRGIGVSVNVAAADFVSAWAAARAETAGRIMVEEYFHGGQEARYLVLDGHCIGVSFRFPAKVQGDGASTVRELVERQNKDKVQRNPSRVDSLLQLDTQRVNLLRASGLTPDTVLESGRELILSEKANLSSGGSCYEYGLAVHDSFLRMAERVAQLVPGSHVLGVDVIAIDHFAPAAPDNYVVLEANTMPGLDLHMFPDYGQPNDVASRIAESCIEKMRYKAAKR